MRTPINQDVLALIRSSIRTVWALELLLLLQKDRRREWNEAGLVRELRASRPVVRDSLVALRGAGVIAARVGRVRYQPRSAPLEDVVERLALAYEQRPGAVVKAIAAAPDDRIQTFADAFRYRP